MGVKADVITSSSETMTLKKAILLYSGRSKSYATVNDVFQAEDGSQQIGAGVAATIESVAELAELLVGNIKMGGFLPDTVLSVAPTSVTWWCKPSVRQVWFHCEDEKVGKRSAKVPCPGLIFTVSESGWSVYAVMGDKRPTPETKMFRAPFFNVWRSGKICTGNVLLPDSSTKESIKEWESAFFRSYFSHPNDNTSESKLVNHKKGAYSFWSDMLDGVHATFPQNVLVDMGMTVDEYLNGAEEGEE
jgi:PRTRC genetic system protein B